MKFGSLGLSSLILTLGLPAMVQAEGGTEISGSVKDSTGAVVVGASVTLRSRDGPTVVSVSTDALGHYRIAGAKAGAHTLTVSKDGFAQVSKEVRVQDAPVTSDFTLNPASFSEEVTVSFTAEHARTALKMEAPVRDVPLTVKSYTNSFVKALDVRTVNEMYTYMNGINRAGDGVFDTVIRGFTNNQQSHNVLMNGMPGFAVRQNAPGILNVERVEVLKGPASVLYGRATPGGLVNIITKRPQAERQHLIELRGGTFAGTGPRFGDANSYRGSADLTGPLGTSRTVLYRLIASYDSADGFRDFFHDEDVIVVPSVTFQLSAGTILTIEGEYRNTDKSLDQGLVAPQNDINFVAPINVRYQEPDDSEKDKGTALAAYFAKAFRGGLALNVTWRSVFHKDERMGFENNRVENDNRRVRRRDRHQINERGYHFLDATLSKTLKTGAISHAALLGFGGGYELRDFDQLRFNNLGFFIDLYNPVYGQAVRPANPNPGTHRKQNLWNSNVYLQDRLDFGERWKGLLALRYDRLDADLTELRFSNPPKSRTDAAFVPTGGIVFQPDSRWSLYGSFATSFEPQAVTAVDVAGQSNFDPEKGRQFEGGAKAELADGKLQPTLAFFHIVKDNVLVDAGAGASEQVGQERSRGLELDLRYQPVGNLQTIFGYTYTGARIMKDRNPNRVGARLINSNKHAFNLWGRYDIPSGPAKGVGFGVGLIWRDDRTGSLPDQAVRTAGPGAIPGQPIPTPVLDLPRYFRADAGLYFVKPRFEVTLRVNNILDETYYESAANLIQVRPGKPREATLSLRLRL